MLVTAIPVIEWDEFKIDQNYFDGSITGICINPEQLHRQEIFQFLLNTNSSYFICVDFRNEHTFGEQRFLESIRQLIALSFNLNYLKIKNNPVIALLSNNNRSEAIVLDIKKEFLKQGYENTVLYELNENCNCISESTNCFFTTKELNENELESLYNLYFNETIIDKMFLVYSLKDKAKQLIEKINNIEIAFANSESRFYSILLSIQKLKSENSLLISETKALNRALQNAEINQKLVRKDAETIIEWYKNEIEKIKDWYNLHYEVLPLWFKRLGNIIKKIKKN